MDYILKSLNELQKITLYHGSSVGNITTFQLNKGRNNLDFGKGVYFTTKLQQAINWSLKRNNTGYVYVCELDIRDLKMLEFSRNCDNFAEIIHFCRIDLEELADEFVDGFDKADAIYGLVVDKKNPQIEKLATQYNEGDISYNEFYRNLDAILFKNNMDQLCIKSDMALSKLNILEVVKTCGNANAQKYIKNNGKDS